MKNTKKIEKRRKFKLPKWDREQSSVRLYISSYRCVWCLHAIIITSSRLPCTLNGFIAVKSKKQKKLYSGENCSKSVCDVCSTSTDI